jgi:DNA-directed RNA polymerase specialized sigma24 family protein
MRNNNAELIQRILDGDDAAFACLVKKYQKRVHALAWRKIGDFHIAEDITQETFLQAYRNLAKLKDRSQFPGSLYVIANRRRLFF